jgi:hypothetical protein
MYGTTSALMGSKISIFLYRSDTPGKAACRILVTRVISLGVIGSKGWRDVILKLFEEL